MTTQRSTAAMKSIRRFLLVATMVACVSLLLILPSRWWRLQRNGQMPADGDRSSAEIENDWRVAQWTTWWGKQIDPREFWKNRVVWNDQSAKASARRRGRRYPPIPTHLTNLVAGFPLSSRSHADIVPGPWSGGPDSGPVTPFHCSNAETAYWDWFWKTKPKPPAILERDQFDVAKVFLRMRKPLFGGGVDMNPIELTNSEARAKIQAREIGVPAEAIGEEAMFWAYVMRLRQEYAESQSGSARIPRTVHDSSVVDERFITEPLTAEQRKLANAWKIAYLQRLRREKVDSSYINAYQTAWNLSDGDIAEK